MPFAIIVRNLRLATGLILIVFVATHLITLALGLDSLAAMEAWRATLMGPWSSLPGTALLLFAAVTHAGLGLYSIARRRSLALSRSDLVQMILGLLTPPLLLAHVLLTRLSLGLAPDIEISYGLMLVIYWRLAPDYAIQQLLVVVLVWVHGAIGLYGWMVLKPAWTRLGRVVLPLLFAVPILALLGFVEAGKAALARFAGDEAFHGAVTANVVRLAAVKPQLDTVQAQVLTVYWAIALAVFALVGWRVFRSRFRTLHVTYDDGRVARGRRGLTVLEVSRLAAVPHAHVCAGRGRCGTCRITLDQGTLSPPGAIEAHALALLHAGAGVRLACQARLRDGDVAVTRLLPAYVGAEAARAPEDWAPRGAAEPVQ
ncbi:(2Fe-2S)-binding protein [Oleomonas cavernae]|uniref:(2Fe-2S)-binding protein n=1 Tax=Oleomonas cavernae TaxID=2320859 RepID=A0A418WB39_9PROT|nr:2Fe-2S iron-sulfur cluster-binding protein [Oleomonas cavernae]RJF87242.1 (2Fe-2S)-binding protein [Oleomonas cavernae]